MASRMSIRGIATALALITPALAQNMKPLTYVGCYSNSNGLSSGDTFQYQSDGHCQEVCVNSNDQAPVLGLTAGNTCLCGSQTPANSAKVDDSKCNTPCTGFGEHMCGGDGFFSVYLTGTEDSVPSVGGGTTSSGNQRGPSTTGTAPSVITSVAPGQTVVVTQSAGSDPNVTPTPEPNKPNTTAIVAGVVVGVVVIAALAGGAFFFLRYRRRQAAQAEYKQHQVSDFMAGGKPTIPAAKRPSGPDPRFDAEAMAHRRLSDGSIADNEDYSRRILKVTNPDDRH